MTAGRRLWLAAGLFALAVALGLMQAAGLFAPFDTFAMRIAGKLHAVPGTGAVTGLSGFLSVIGADGARFWIVLVIGLFLARAGLPRLMMWLIAAAAAPAIGTMVLKLAFAAPRPEVIEPLARATTYSFPSGHAAGAVVLYGAIALLLRRRLVTLLCVGAMLATGASRVWLGVHWPSDVIGGWIEGLGWLLILSLLPHESQTSTGRMRLRA